MAKTPRITFKTLKEDEVRSYWLDLINRVRENRKALLIGVVSLLALLVIVQIFRHRAAARANTATILLSQARTEIEAALLRPPDRMDEQTRERLFGSADEKLQLLSDFYRRSNLAPYALYLRGNIAFFRNNYDEAANFYTEYLDKVSDPTEKADGYIALGYTYENKFFWTAQKDEDRVWLDRALQNYLEAENLTSGTLQHYQAMLGRARLYDLQEDRAAQAKELYERIERERKLEPPKLWADAKQSPQTWLLNQAEQMKYLFTLAETARLRRERLEAGR